MKWRPRQKTLDQTIDEVNGKTSGHLKEKTQWTEWSTEPLDGGPK